MKERQLLSKTSFMHFLECPLWLWLDKVRPDLLPELSAGDQQRIEQGELVDDLARALYPGGVTIEGFNRVGFAATKHAIANGAKVLYQPTAMADGLTARGDMLVKRPGGIWDLHEVKSATSVKKEYPVDLAFQRMCFERAGIPIGRTFLAHVNNTYIRKGKINAKRLFTEEDITRDSGRHAETIQPFIDQAREVLSWPKTLTAKHLRTCSKPRTCEFLKACISAFGPKKKPGKIVSEPAYDSRAIAKELSTLKYPLYFLDYETYGPAVPPFNGYRPWQAIPFQFSVYVLDAPDATPHSFDFLMDSFEDPALPLIEALREAIGPEGNVISWHAPFEKSRNEELAKMHPKHASFLRGINRRMFDLLLIFRGKLYDDPAFGGSASLKAVMPVLVPGLSYKTLNIQVGSEASASWPILTSSGLSERKRAQLRRDMIDYCRLDVFGMVEILKKLDTL